jgi:hypothetical protein
MFLAQTLAHKAFTDCQIAIYLVGQWYPPDRTQFRMALFYCASAASGAFSGLLAAAIAKMNGMQVIGGRSTTANTQAQAPQDLKAGAGSSS